MHHIALLAIALWPVAVLARPRSTVQNSILQKSFDNHCNCKGTNQGNGAAYVCGDARLGPVLLPWELPMLSLVSDYQRLGDLPTPANFLAKWWKPTPNNTKHPEGTWAYPEHDGFQLDIKGDPIRSYMNLTVGYKVDRFGDEKTGHFIASADAPFAQRSLPPSALNTDDAPHPFAYHVYEVIREFTVVGGPAGPGFEQPGGGIQFNISESIKLYESDGKPKRAVVLDLLNAEYIKRLDLPVPGPTVPQKCGQNPVDCSCKRPQLATWPDGRDQNNEL